ncbi:SMP-30/gluconolactonase/LRE family protein [Enterobacter hormaechei]|uniref:SMP-30/gluconolactonase/LRE family protein n=1 Tax=Enterobacter hormaechei TaxID=158836 RepID=UPI003F27141B
MNGLNHNALTRSAVPIPPCERSLQTVEAQPYFSVSEASLVLEGAVFDRNNNLLFVDAATGRVFKLTPERQLSIVLKENTFGASGLAVHKDGRIFIASVGDMQRGSVRAIEPDGTREQMIVDPEGGFLANDLVFDNQGGFYFTDSRGNSADPQGGVFYVSPNVGSIHAILPGLAVGNGLAIDPDGTLIWATEHAKFICIDLFLQRELWFLRKNAKGCDQNQCQRTQKLDCIHIFTPEKFLTHFQHRLARRKLTNYRWQFRFAKRTTLNDAFNALYALVQEGFHWPGNAGQLRV